MNSRSQGGHSGAGTRHLSPPPSSGTAILQCRPLLESWGLAGSGAARGGRRDLPFPARTGLGGFSPSGHLPPPPAPRHGLPGDTQGTNVPNRLRRKAKPRWLSGKESACHAGDQVRSLGGEDPLEEGMATRSSILAW